MANVRIAFEIIIRHFSDQTFESQTEIYNRVLEIYREQDLPEPVPTLECVRRTLRFLKHFDLVDGENRNWHIKSVGDMCKRLIDLIDNRNI